MSEIIYNSNIKIFHSISDIQFRNEILERISSKYKETLRYVERNTNHNI